MINEFELSEKFNEIFVDDDVFIYFHKWHDEKIRKEDTRTWIQKTLPWIPLFIFACTLFFTIWYFCFRDRVEQSVKEFMGEQNLITLVWVNGNIVESYYRPLRLVNDSVKTALRIEGERILKLAK